MINNRIIDYRKKHPRCRYCKYKHYVEHVYIGIFYNECILKDKIINNYLGIAGIFCKWFEVNGNG